MRLLSLAMIMCLAAQAQAQNDTTRIARQYEIDELVVTGARFQTDVRHLPMTVNVVGREKLTENQRVNVLPTLNEQVPGLFLTQRGMFGFGVSTGGSGSITLRGVSAGAGQLLVLIDGHPQYQGIYGHSIADSYQTMMTERVEVLRGPASMLYGSNAMGGVINIVTRGMKQDGVKTQVNLGAGSYGTVQAEASNQVRSGKFSSTVSGQYARTDNHRPRMGFEQYGGYVKLGYELNENWNIYADADITHFNASNPGSVAAPMNEMNQYITRGVVTAALENHYANTSGALSVYDNFGRHKINDGYADGADPQKRLFRSKDALTGISWYQSINMFEGNRVTVGFDFQHIFGDAYYTSRATGEVLETQNKQSARKHMNEVAGYVDVRQDLSSWLTIDAGIRYDHHSVVGGEWIPQAGLVIRPNSTGEFKAMLSKGFRNPTMREMYLYPPSNEELKAERIMNYELSWKQRLGTFSYGVNLFYLKGDNMIQTVNRQNVNTGAIQNNGVEVEAAWRINEHWSVNTNHSLLHMHNKVVAAPNYKGYLGANFHQGRWSLNAGLQQICDLYTSVGEKPTTEDFTLLNATVGYKAAKGVNLYVKGENLLDQTYEINQGYPMPGATFMGGVNIEF